MLVHQAVLFDAPEAYFLIHGILCENVSTNHLKQKGCQLFRLKVFSGILVPRMLLEIHVPDFESTSIDFTKFVSPKD